jgi:hypothetical protein
LIKLPPRDGHEMILPVMEKLQRQKRRNGHTTLPGSNLISDKAVRRFTQFLNSHDPPNDGKLSQRTKFRNFASHIRCVVHLKFYCAGVQVSSGS